MLARLGQCQGLFACGSLNANVQAPHVHRARVHNGEMQPVPTGRNNFTASGSPKNDLLASCKLSPEPEVMDCRGNQRRMQLKPQRKSFIKSFPSMARPGSKVEREG